jgi:alanine racemase
MKDQERASDENLPASDFEHAAHRPTRAEIDLDNLAHNFRIVRKLAGPDCAIMPAMKADAYGHGAVECARALAREGANWFGVALPEEGVKLREAGIDRPILCLGGFWEGQEESLIAHSLTPAMFRLDLLERLDRAALSAGLIVNYHLKIDTGMGRLGVPLRDLGGFLDRAGRLQNVRLDGVMAHFASADEPGLADFTRQQIARFENSVGQMRARGLNPSWIHQANSAALQPYPEARGNLVRVGGVVYGLWRDVTSPLIDPPDWRPVMSLRTRISYLKRVPAGSPLGYGCTFVTRRASLIATLPIGYGDGFPRALSNRGRVLVRGQSAPIVGRVSMDLTLIDVTDIPDAAVGDEAVALGCQGDDCITAEEIAALIGTISYEVTCSISNRVPRKSSESFVPKSPGFEIGID